MALSSMLAAGIAFAPHASGMTWDEAYYYPTFVDVRNWTGLLLSNPAAALSADGIRAGWERIHELPPVVKWLGALSVAFGGEGWARLSMLRYVPFFSFLFTLVVVYRLSQTVLRPAAALAVVWTYALIPVIAGHANFAATETTFIAVMGLVLAVCFAERPGWAWRLLLAVAVGLALATKVNGIVLLIAVISWLLARGIFESRDRTKILPAFKRDLVTIGVVLAVSPIVALAIWPWMWHDTFARLAEYWRFVREHSHQSTWYFGERWNTEGRMLPITYPLVVFHLTTPLVLVAAIWCGLAAQVCRTIRQRRIARRTLLLALAAAGPFAAASLPGTPKYDGTRLFLPAMLPLIVLSLTGLFAAMRSMPSGARIAVLVLIPLGTFARPSIDYYNPIAKMIARGEPVFPFEVTYWCNGLTKSMIEHLDEKAPKGAKIKTLAMQPDVLMIYQKWGVLRADMVIDGPPPYDYHLMQNRKGFWGRAEWSIFTGREPLFISTDGYGEEPAFYLFDGAPP